MHYHQYTLLVCTCIPYRMPDGSDEHMLVSDVADELLTTRSHLNRRSMRGSQSSRDLRASTPGPLRARLFGGASVLHIALILYLCLLRERLSVNHVLVGLYPQEIFSINV